MQELAGKVALVTGASRGIGAGIARSLAAAGARVAVNHSRSAEEADQVVGQIARAGGKAVAVQADVSDRAAVVRMADKVLSHFGRLDILVNNAGVARDGPLLSMPEEDWRAVLDVNLTGTWLCAQAAARVMLEQGAGRIINISASTGIRGRKNGANYCAAKAGVIALTKCLALELAPAIQVNCLCPGFVPTADVVERFGFHDETVREQMRRNIPLARFGTPEDVGRAAVFLAGPGADYITGHVLFVNGGLFMY